MKCPDCGTSCESNGMCSNCHEELYILTYQYEYVDFVSDEFRSAADSQAEQLKRCKINPPEAG